MGRCSSAFPPPDAFDGTPRRGSGPAPCGQRDPRGDGTFPWQADVAALRHQACGGAGSWPCPLPRGSGCACSREGGRGGRLPPTAPSPPVVRAARCSRPTRRGNPGGASHDDCPLVDGDTLMVLCAPGAGSAPRKAARAPRASASAAVSSREYGEIGPGAPPCRDGEVHPGRRPGVADSGGCVPRVHLPRDGCRRRCEPPCSTARETSQAPRGCSEALPCNRRATSTTSASAPTRYMTTASCLKPLRRLPAPRPHRAWCDGAHRPDQGERPPVSLAGLAAAGAGRPQLALGLAAQLNAVAAVNQPVASARVGSVMRPCH
jgi:hypothetical protein